MKISHKELETCRLSPRAWLALRKEASESGASPRFSYNQALNYAIAELHKVDDLTRALSKLDSYLVKFKDENRKEAVRERLVAYSEWLKDSGVVPLDSNVTINFPSSGEWHLGGWVSRVDVTANGYSAVLFGLIEPAWKAQLRMPLIQLAIADQYGRPPSEVKVGFHNLDGNSTAEYRFSKATMDDALTEFMGIGNRIRKLNPALFS